MSEHHVCRVCWGDRDPTRNNGPRWSGPEAGEWLGRVDCWDVWAGNGGVWTIEENRRRFWNDAEPCGNGSPLAQARALRDARRAAQKNDGPAMSEPVVSIDLQCIYCEVRQSAHERALYGFPCSGERTAHEWGAPLGPKPKSEVCTYCQAELDELRRQLASAEQLRQHALALRDSARNREGRLEHDLDVASKALRALVQANMKRLGEDEIGVFIYHGIRPTDDLLQLLSVEFSLDTLVDALVVQIDNELHGTNAPGNDFSPATLALSRLAALAKQKP